ncbi:D-alanyl-D-alanine carboxypeptidase family protein [Candidatus Arthromitus sp. SFB-rat-Yit]|uniref:D-alanyl-D-alanine carboxypeptidase family protein n=1 Tax=Candidatus Arthromitus sp. SFB-rat-Yit TaxID=1041504 RepID=UPI000227A5F2|nr:serine hydrolase [Candidatus Arthromitus sp. SFB-rat-Yit]BAK81647.1 D-alanyl-D-alanine carboxypeptidase family protein [Candidatus Arthromitus sp. SFB-rat-Yit]
MFKLLISIIFSLSVIFTSVSAEEINNYKIYGESYVVIDGDTNEVILSKNADAKMYPASISKLITAILLAEHKTKKDTLIFTSRAKEMPEYSVNLNYSSFDVGQELSADFVMKSILIFSANDMAQVVADNLSDELGKSFEEIMNDKLRELGLKNTYFKNAIGLHDDDHYSTAYDLALLLEAALKYDWIRETISIKETSVSLPNGSIIVYKNSNKLLGTDGMIGGKTGYTSRSGRNLVGAFEKDGKSYIITVLKSIYDSEDSYVFNDMENLKQIAEKQEKALLYEKGSVVSESFPLEYKLFGFFGPKKVAQVPLILNDNVYMYDNDYNKQNLSTNIYLKDNINIFTDFNKPIGTFEVLVSDSKSSYNLSVDMKPIILSNILIYTLSILLILVIIILIMIIIKRIRGKKRVKRIF